MRGAEGMKRAERLRRGAAAASSGAPARVHPGRGRISTARLVRPELIQELSEGAVEWEPHVGANDHLEAGGEALDCGREGKAGVLVGEWGLL